MLWHKKTQSLSSLALILVFLLLTSCFENLTGQNSSQTPSSLLNPISPADDVSLPISYLDDSQIFVAQNDSEGFIPVVFFPDAIEWNQEHQFTDTNNDGFYDDVFLVVTTDENDLSEFSNNKSQIQNSNLAFSDLIFRKAFAQANTVQYCAVQTNNAVECFFNSQNQSPQKLYFTLGDANHKKYSDVYSESIQPSMYYVKQAPQDLLYAKNELYVITQNQGVEIVFSETDQKKQVQGAYTENYEAFATQDSKIIYDDKNDFFATLNQQTGLSLLKQIGNQVWQNVASYTQNKATQFTVFKNYGETIYYGIEQNNAEEASLYNLYENTAHYSNLADLQYDHLQFLNSTNNLDVMGQKILHKKTLGFDFNSDGFALILFQDSMNQFRLRAVNASGSVIGGKRTLHSPYANTFDFQDIQFYDHDRALILDKLNDRLWVVEFNQEDKILSAQLNHFVQVGHSPVQMRMNQDKTQVYVLNEVDESISIVSLASSDLSKRYHPEILGTFYLKDLFPKKSFNFAPQTLTLSETSLFVGSTKTQSILEIPFSELDVDEAPDEDFDQDGFTPTQGDCQDNQVSINPNATELCGDAIDNNCSGEIDEGCDFDEDGFTISEGDCNDQNKHISPRSDEICGDVIDNNCNGSIDEDCDDGVFYY